MDEPRLDTFRVVLCGAEGPQNVGAACRAMKAMGLGRLSLAACPSFDEVAVRTQALHAFDLYESAERFETLREALAGSSLAAGFTRRTGRRRKEAVRVDDFAAGLAGAPGREVALVFGNERSGLSAEELDLCDMAVSIPTSEAFPSLNLSHAVQVACWELRRSLLSTPSPATQQAIGARPAPGTRCGPTAASRSMVEATASRMADALEEAGLYRLAGREDAESFLRSVLARAALGQGELERVLAVTERLAALSRKLTAP